MRTTEELVKAIFEDGEITDSLTPYIAVANALVTKICAKAGNGYSTDELTQIETWLSAHFYTVRDPRVTSESAGEVSASYANPVGLYLASSRYGQTAMLLDTEGGLANLNKATEEGSSARKVGIFWAGKKSCKTTRSYTV